MGNIDPLVVFPCIAGLLLVFNVWYMSRHDAGRHLKRQAHHSGRDYLFTRAYQGKGRRHVKISAGAPVQNGFTFSIARESWWHRMLKGLNLASELQTGDPVLDAEFFFAADDEAQLKVLLESADFIAALRAVFKDIRLQSVEGRGDRLWFETVTLDRQQEPPESACADYALNLAAALEKIQVPDHVRLMPVSSRARLALVFHFAQTALPLGAALAAVYYFVQPGAMDKRVLDLMGFAVFAGKVAVGVLAAWFAVIVAGFGRTPWFPRVFKNFLAAGVLGIILATAASVWHINIAFDSAAVAMKSLPLQSKACSLHCTTGGKNARTATHALSDQACSSAQMGATRAHWRTEDNRCRRTTFNYNLYLPWPEEGRPGMTYRVKTDVGTYERAGQSQPMRFPLHAGALGLPWVNIKEVVPE